MKTNENGIYDARTLGLPKMLILGLQHMFAMFGATILVPVLVNTYFHGEGLSIQVTLFCAGIGTALPPDDQIQSTGISRFFFRLSGWFPDSRKSGHGHLCRHELR